MTDHARLQCAGDGVFTECGCCCAHGSMHGFAAGGVQWGRNQFSAFVCLFTTQLAGHMHAAYDAHATAPPRFMFQQARHPRHDPAHPPSLSLSLLDAIETGPRHPGGNAERLKAKKNRDNTHMAFLKRKIGLKWAFGRTFHH